MNRITNSILLVLPASVPLHGSREGRRVIGWRQFECCSAVLLGNVRVKMAQQTP